MASTFTRTEKITLFSIALGCFLLHLITNLTGAYGFFRDELYYITCSDHLAFGYVDQPPFSLYLLKLSRLLFGDSLTAIRIVPTLMHTGTIVVAGLMVKEMGGKVFAIFIAGIAIALAPILLGIGSIYSMNSIDVFIWTLSVYLILRIINTKNQSLWIALGIVLGIGLLNKISVLFFGAGLFVGILFTNRQWLITRWPYIAASIGVILFLPYVVWNVTHDMAHLEFIHNASSDKYSGLNAATFIKDQLFYLNPIAAPLWMSGLLGLFFYAPLKKYRIVAWIYVTAFTILILNGTSKAEYLMPAYASLFAAAGVLVEQKLTSRSVAWIKYAYAMILLITSIILIPMVLPVLSVEGYIRYAKALGEEPSSNEGKELSDLPQFYADMFGWKEKAKDVASIYNSLSEDDKKKCAIIASNYGRCGAIDFFGPEYGLPKSIGTHNNYWIWGPRDYNGEVLIIMGGDLDDHKNDFESVALAGVSNCEHCMPYENKMNIFVCRGLKHEVKDVWSHEKHYD
ncbi:MAG TPA: glycosyltransferase family 39 protein [Chryseolinea sp.]|nr:glycosyltransferase family 39 protein [Chryseolinea sp.]HPM29757.1 glycosyltransferase family 39 protein [Chryseolinea sp.]